MRCAVIVLNWIIRPRILFMIALFLLIFVNAINDVRVLSATESPLAIPALTRHEIIDGRFPT